MENQTKEKEMSFAENVEATEILEKINNSVVLLDFVKQTLTYLSTYKLIKQDVPEEELEVFRSKYNQLDAQIKEITGV